MEGRIPGPVSWPHEIGVKVSSFTARKVPPLRQQVPQL